jgi:superfamily II DNA or RNA helicase
MVSLARGDPLVQYDLFEERAAIMEYEGGLSRADAEAAARACLAPPSTAITLRPYQRQAVSALREALDKGVRNWTGACWW